MSEASDLRQKAETCVRLAGSASSPRALELLQKLAEEYRAKAQEIEEPTVAPPLAPAQIVESVDSPPLAPSTASEQWLAELKALRARL